MSTVQPLNPTAGSAGAPATDRFDIIDRPSKEEMTAFLKGLSTVNTWIHRKQRNRPIQLDPVVPTLYNLKFVKRTDLKGRSDLSFPPVVWNGKEPVALFSSKRFPRVHRSEGKKIVFAISLAGNVYCRTIMKAYGEEGTHERERAEWRAKNEIRKIEALEKAKIPYMIEVSYMAIRADKLGREQYFYDTPFYPRGDLLDHIQNFAERWNVPKKVEFFRKITTFVAELHGNKLAYNDLKPEQVLLTDNDEPRIIDFESITNDDHSGEVVDSPAYWAPETYGKIMNKEPMQLKPRDCWVLGIIGYLLFRNRTPTLLTGEMPEGLIQKLDYVMYEADKIMWQLQEDSFELEKLRKPGQSLEEVQSINVLLNGLLERYPIYRFTARDALVQMDKIAPVKKEEGKAAEKPATDKGDKKGN